jgi:hypothetical protein
MIYGSTIFISFGFLNGVIGKVYATFGACVVASAACWTAENNSSSGVECQKLHSFPKKILCLPFSTS